jgi:hypothetical protein
VLVSKLCEKYLLLHMDDVAPMQNLPHCQRRENDSRARRTPMRLPCSLLGEPLLGVTEPAIRLRPVGPVPTLYVIETGKFSQSSIVDFVTNFVFGLVMASPRSSWRRLISSMAGRYVLGRRGSLSLHFLFQFELISASRISFHVAPSHSLSLCVFELSGCIFFFFSFDDRGVGSCTSLPLSLTMSYRCEVIP